MAETKDNACRGYRGTDFYAMHLLCHSRLPGRLRLAHIGTAEDLLAARRIDKHIRFSPAEGVELDVWLIRGRPGDPSPLTGEGGPKGRGRVTDSSKAHDANFSAAPSDRPCPGTVLILHGLWDSKARFFPLGELLARRGFDVVMPDLRRHGDSTGGYTTFGSLEKHDMLALMTGLRAAGDVRGPLWVFGFSMGAAITVRYAALDPLVRGAVAAAPFSDAKTITRRTVPLMSDRKFDAVWARAAGIAGFDPADTSTVEAARSLRCPLIVIHGRLDLIVPHSHGRAVFEAAPQPKRFYSVGWAGHPALLLKGRRWFADRIDEVIAMAGGANDAKGAQGVEVVR
jgi:pimeloyl-ACP methyl ester carboxylesterase